MSNNPNYIGSVFGMFGDQAHKVQTDHLQARVELDYIKAGNDYISTQMNSLANAVKLTNTILQNLDQLQQIKNLIYIPSIGTFSAGPDTVGPSTTGTSYVKQYIQRASAFFNHAIGPFLALNGGQPLSTGAPSTYSLFRFRLQGLSNALQSELTVIANLSSGGTSSDLYSRLQAVVTDISSNLGTTTGGQSGVGWLLDGYAVGGNQASFPTKEGSIQNNLGYAITAAQSLNTTQQENVRSFFFTFQQFYQSASAILTQLNQLMQRIAQGIKS